MNRLKTAALMGLIALPLGLRAEYTAPLEKHYKTKVALMRDFLRVSKKQDAPFTYWIDQLGHHISDKQKFGAFERQLNSALQKKDADRVLKVFKAHKDLFGYLAQAEFLKLGLDKVRNAFKTRVLKAGRALAPKVEQPVEHPMVQPDLAVQERPVEKPLTQKPLFAAALKKILERTRELTYSEEEKELHAAWCKQILATLSNRTRTMTIAPKLLLLKLATSS